MAERGGFEPPIHFCIHDFQSWALSHSAIFPIIHSISKILKKNIFLYKFYEFFSMKLIF
jgi:hypothetical protein